MRFPFRLIICFVCFAILAPAQRQWAGPAEYELFENAQSEQDPALKLYRVERWRSAYPESEFRDLQLRLTLSAYQQLGRLDDAFRTAAELVNLNPNAITVLHWLVSTGPKLPSPTAEQIEIVAAAAYAILAPVPTPATFTAVLNGVPAKVRASEEPKRPPPVPPTTLESSTPEGQAVTAMLSEWRRNHRPTPDPTIQRRKDAESALEWVEQFRR